MTYQQTILTNNLWLIEALLKNEEIDPTLPPRSARRQRLPWW
jgi:hypothetical protein